MYLELTNRVPSYALLTNVPPMSCDASSRITSSNNKWFLVATSSCKYLAATKPEGPAPITNARRWFFLFTLIAPRMEIQCNSNLEATTYARNCLPEEGCLLLSLALELTVTWQMNLTVKKCKGVCVCGIFFFGGQVVCPCVVKRGIFKRQTWNLTLQLPFVYLFLLFLFPHNKMITIFRAHHCQRRPSNLSHQDIHQPFSLPQSEYLHSSWLAISIHRYQYWDWYYTFYKGLNCIVS